MVWAKTEIFWLLITTIKAESTMEGMTPILGGDGGGTVLNIVDT